MAEPRTNPNITPNTPGLVRLCRAELEAARAARRAGRSTHRASTDQRGDSMSEPCAACPFLRCADCRYQTPTEPAATEGTK